MRCKSYRSWGDALARNLRAVEVIGDLPKDFVLSTAPGAVNRPDVVYKTYLMNYETNELTLMKEDNE